MFVINCAVLFKQVSWCQAKELIVVTLSVCGAEVTDEAEITSASGNITPISIEYVLSKQLCLKQLTCCALLISCIQYELTPRSSQCPH